MLPTADCFATTILLFKLFAFLASNVLPFVFDSCFVRIYFAVNSLGGCFTFCLYFECIILAW